MEVFLARQPIFDRDLKVFGYELLHRSCLMDTFNSVDGNLASMQVLANTLLAFGATDVLGGKLGFINFTRDLLLSDLALLLPPASFVIEILESVESDDRVIETCRVLKSKGYSLALDDIVPNRPSLRLADFVDIIKVDFAATSEAERATLLKEYGKSGIRMLAEKVETHEQFKAARKQGFTYFQGYFFARPVIMAKREIPAFKLNILRILAEVYRPEIDFEEVERAIKQEMPLCYRLLRYVNSAAFARRVEIGSVKQALLLLGADDLRRWVSLAAVPALASDKPEELVESAVLRARFCELIAPWIGLSRRRSELFLMGMFSLLDTIVSRPLDELLGEISLAEDVRDVLLGGLNQPGRLAQVYQLVRACEIADWDEVSRSADDLGMPADVVSDLYLEALKWCSRVFHAGERAEPGRLVTK